MRVVVASMKERAENASAKRIAVNTKMTSFAFLLAFKSTYRNIFGGSEIATTIFSNKVIEVITVDDINNILNVYHHSLLGGHRGYERRKNSIRALYFWPTMNKDIKKFVKDCSICEKSKITRYTKTPMAITSPATEPFSKIFIDFVGEISPNSLEGYKHIFTCQCDLTKFVVAVSRMICTLVRHFSQNGG